MSLKISFKVDTEIRNSNESCLHVYNHVSFEIAFIIELSLTYLTLELRIQMTLAHVHNHMNLKISFKGDTGIRNSNESYLHVKSCKLRGCFKIRVPTKIQKHSSMIFP